MSISDENSLYAFERPVKIEFAVLFIKTTISELSKLNSYKFVKSDKYFKFTTIFTIIYIIIKIPDGSPNHKSNFCKMFH